MISTFFGILVETKFKMELTKPKSGRGGHEISLYDQSRIRYKTDRSAQVCCHLQL